MNGITYFRLNSSYDGDITKNCALTGSEVDNNFYTLEGRDIKSIEIQDGKIVVNLLNGEKLSTEKIAKGIENLEIDFDSKKGELTITKDGEVKTIDGFVTYDNVGDAISQIVDDAVSGVHINGTVYTNSTISGNGSSQSPIGVSSVAKTGQYRPVKAIINTLDGEKLPSCASTFPGDRYLTVEKVNDFGFLYNYEGLKNIACNLQEKGSLWRIPTKEDWDDMLNAIEPKEEYRTHSDARSNKYLGMYAGKFLKSKNYWKKENNCTCEDTTTQNSCEESNPCTNSCNCNETYCGEVGSCHCCCSNNEGIDKYGFNAIPSGYANEAKDYMYFKERAYFWTASNHDYRDAYAKILTYNKSSVLQDIMAADNYMSVRLVKDYNGTNFNEREDILGDSYSTVLMPSLKKGSAIWTSVNISISNCDCGCNYILPNDGEGMEYTKRFFTNEWNGQEWIRKEVLEGETVVVIKDGDKNHVEYCVINGELVSIEKKLYDEIYGQIEPQIKDIQKSIDIIDGEIEETNKKIEIVNNNLVTSINEINKNVAEGFDNINKNMADGFTTINEAVDVERKRIDNLDERVTNVEHDAYTATNLVHIQEGSLYDKEKGILTLKSKGGENDINIQFDFNFGTF